MNNAPIGIFDSDIGGLSVVARLRKRAPHENIVYFADTANYPYGTKTEETVGEYFLNAIRFLQEKKAKAVLCACSTASAVAVPKYQHSFSIPILGLFNEELPHIVHQISCSKKIGIIATELTVKSQAFNRLFDASGYPFELQSLAAGKLVNAITLGKLDEQELDPVLDEVLSNFSLTTLGAMIIGCTHFYHVRNILREKLTGIPVVEPAKVAVDCLMRDLSHEGLLTRMLVPGKTICYTSGDTKAFQTRVQHMEAIQNQSYIDEFIL